MLVKVSVIYHSDMKDGVDVGGGYCHISHSDMKDSQHSVDVGGGYCHISQ